MDKGRKADKQNKEMQNSKEKEYTQNLVFGLETETAYDLEEGGEKSGEDLSPKKETKEAEGLKSTACDLKHEPAGGGGNPSSALCNRGPHKPERHSRGQ